jgi:hypothetical protein
MTAQNALAIPAEMTVLTRREEVTIVGGLAAILLVALEVAGVVAGLVIIAAIAGGVVYALTH